MQDPKKHPAVSPEESPEVGVVTGELGFEEVPREQEHNLRIGIAFQAFKGPWEIYSAWGLWVLCFKGSTLVRAKSLGDLLEDRVEGFTITVREMFR